MPEDPVVLEEERTGPARKCVATGLRGSKSDLIRFVVGPDDILVPDLDEKLPGRGMWLQASADAVATAVKRKAFQRAAARAGRTAIRVPDDLATLLVEGLRRRILDGLGLARRAGQAVTGFEKVKALVAESDPRIDPEIMAGAGSVGVLLHASDGAVGGFSKLGPGARQLEAEGKTVEVMTADALGAPFDRDRAVHVAVLEGKLADRILRDATRLKNMVPAPGSREGGA
ncbi:MAG: RNA-binding protein [Alphaproteobacteria bacterium]|nr:RNA-binding protein [Alphaproteobacteria bacterium]